MKKTIWLFAVVALMSVQAFASYIVVLKDGTKYTAKAKPVIAAGKARVTLENGQTLLFNPGDIDTAKSEQMTKLGLGQVSIIAIDTPQAGTQPSTATQPPSLGSTIKLRPRPTFGEESAPVKPNPQVAAPIADQLDAGLKDKFERAYENIGIYEHKLSGTNRNIRVELTADNEDKVFNALSATAFLIVRNAGLNNMQIDVVEIFMKTTNGGAAGRFQMTRADADAVNTKTMSLQDYFVRKVIY